MLAPALEEILEPLFIEGDRWSDLGRLYRDPVTKFGQKASLQAEALSALLPDVSSPAAMASSGGGIVPNFVMVYPYTRANAVSYANTWWNSRNPAYNSYGDSDCANFVSQCVDAGSGGNWRFGSGSYPDNQKWYPYTSSWIYCPNQVAAWTYAKAWYSPAAYIVAFSSSKPSGFSTGDVAWLYSGGVAQHALICTSFSGSTPLFTCHSSSYHNKPLSFWGASDQRYGQLANLVYMGPGQ